MQTWIRGNSCSAAPWCAADMTTTETISRSDEIGRASCRERGKISVVAVSLQKKTDRDVSQVDRNVVGCITRRFIVIDHHHLGQWEILEFSDDPAERNGSRP